MAEPTPPRLQKLPGFAFNVLGVNRAWLADDHLLISSSAAAFETYRRYYYREIKAVVVRPTAVGLAWKIILGVLVAILAGAAVALLVYDRKNGFFPRATLIFGAISLLPAAVLIFHLLRGKTGRVYVQTRAGIEPLAAPVHVGAAYQLQAALRPRIAEAQGVDNPAPTQPPPPPPGVAPVPGGFA